MSAVSRWLAYCAVGLISIGVPLSAQAPGRVDARNLYYRVYAIVPFTGGGSATAGPRRPKHAPVASSSAAARQSGILAWAMVESDDHQHALVEFVGANRAALQEVLQDSSIQVFERNKSSAAQVETAFQQYRKGFSLKYFGVRMP